MSETLDHLTYTVYVSRKNSAMDYGNGSADEASAHVQVDLPIGTDPTSDEAQVALRNAFNAAKAQVAVTLGMTTALDDEGTLQYEAGTIQAEVNAVTADAVVLAFPGATTVSPPTSVAGLEDGQPPAINPERGSDGEKANSKWAKVRFGTHPQEFFDNSETKTNPKGPDVKHKKFNKHGGWTNDLVGWLN